MVERKRKILANLFPRWWQIWWSAIGLHLPAFGELWLWQDRVIRLMQQHTHDKCPVSQLSFDVLLHSWQHYEKSFLHWRRESNSYQKISEGVFLFEKQERLVYIEITLQWYLYFKDNMEFNWTRKNILNICIFWWHQIWSRYYSF